MSLKLIPFETLPQEKEKSRGDKNKKNFNPGDKLKKEDESDSNLRSMCLRLIHFINRGSKFTYEQVDDLIVGMHQSILRLQKKKQEILKKKGNKRKGN